MTALIDIPDSSKKLSACVNLNYKSLCSFKNFSERIQLIHCIVVKYMEQFRSWCLISVITPHNNNNSHKNLLYSNTKTTVS